MSGYPCEDLWQKKHFIDDCKSKILEIMAFSKNKKCAILISSPSIVTERENEVLRNSAFLIEDGEIKNIIYKKTLPNYGVFDEKRYFNSVNSLNLVNFRGYKFGILICEDIWDEKNLFLLKEQNIDGIISINASPYQLKKHQIRVEAVKIFAETLRVPIFYVNQIGAQDG
ncbi:MAG: nitrilase-related carbon-nitrogen hydrolase, partial [Alphaproteobacteria bacterium]